MYIGIYRYTVYLGRDPTFHGSEVHHTTSPLPRDVQLFTQSEVYPLFSLFKGVRLSTRIFSPEANDFSLGRGRRDEMDLASREISPLFRFDIKEQHYVNYIAYM